MKKNLGLYIHIPFCESKCHYCGFLSFSKDSLAREEYVDLLVKEIKLAGREQEDSFLDTIFIGGGTPSLLTPMEMDKILRSVYQSFSVDPKGEISMEGNPNSLVEEKLKAYKDMGINRLTMGVQSLNDNVLKRIGRLHTKKDVFSSYSKARDVGFSNINMDLMFALPGQGMDCWKETIREILTMEPEHLSFYSLQLEENTSFYDQYRSEKLKLASNEEERFMYHYGIQQFKESGYVHYEISNTCKESFECKHNLKYWSMEDFEGVGLGASFYSKGIRGKNVEDMKEYQELLGREERPFQRENLVKEEERDAMGIFAFTSLRKKEGLDFLTFKKRFGQDFFLVYEEKLNALREYEKKGYVQISRENIELTEKGIDYSNAIMEEFI